MDSLKKISCCETLGCKMAHTLKAMIKEMSARFVEHQVDLTMEQYFLLNILDNEQELILQDIADMLEKDKSAVARHINALEKKHFVARATCDEDKRKKLLFLTKPGLEVLNEAKRISNEFEEELTAQITGKHLKIFEQVLVDIVKKSAA